ncbi:hypothetical protein OQA88_7329 [Cercophora sp. LCS_1]
MFRGNYPNSFSEALSESEEELTSKPKGMFIIAAPRSASPAPSEQLKQPTYTTVGSIYNPDAAVPLQPPTRRPRNRRYAPTLFSPAGDALFGLPGSILLGFSARDRVQDSPPPIPLPHYSPLQQNYDRAVSPGTEQEEPPSYKIGMSVPTIRSGNLPARTLGPAFSLSTAEKSNLTALGDSDSAASEDTLATSRITVKGLTNLASYPNPMQKAAQNTLARARTVNLTLGRSATPSSVHTASDFGKERVTSTPPVATGTPRPLTAGPPGQRQFKPSTLDTSLRTGTFEGALDLSSSVTNETIQPSLPSFGNQAERDGLTLKPHRVFSDDHLSQVGRIDPSTTGLQLPLEHRPAAPYSGFGQIPYDWNTRATMMSPVPYMEVPIRDTLPEHRISEYYPWGLPRDYAGKTSRLDESSCYDSPRPPLGPAEEMAAEQKRRLNQRFYSGTRVPARDVPQMAREHDDHSPKKNIGVIGEGRDRFKASQLDGAPVLSVEEAIRMDGPLLAEPLLNMTLATLLRHRDGHRMSDPKPNYREADPAWIDGSADGNKSFFDVPRVDKKKRLVRWAHRNYWAV